MAAWSDGYLTDVQYTGKFYSELAPGFLTFACLRQGVRPPSLGPGSSYLELGCGQGYGLNLLAAANPAMSFRGVDFHPGQIDNANRLARAAGLSNVAFDDASFEQMLDAPAGTLERSDVVVLHGVWSWVNPENRAIIARLLDRVVAPGGLVYVSYNCLPGWAPLIPLQRFIATHAAASTGDLEVRVMDAFKAALQLAEGDLGYFGNAPGVRAKIQAALKDNPAYLIHEYLHDDPSPSFHAEVARELATARLWFAASANVADDLLNLAAPAALQPTLQAAQDPVWRETLLDYASNKAFRRDVFVRGRNALGAGERAVLLAELRFGLMGPPGQGPYEFQIPIGRLTGQPALYQAIIDALTEGPRSYGELAELPQAAGSNGASALLQAVTLLVGGRSIHPLAEAGGKAGAAHAFNRAVLDRIQFDEFPRHLAAPQIGTGVGVEFTDLFFLNAVLEGRKDPATVADGIWPMMARTGRRLVENGEPLLDQAANEAALAERFGRFRDAKLPVFRALGVI